MRKKFLFTLIFVYSAILSLLLCGCYNNDPSIKYNNMRVRIREHIWITLPESAVIKKYEDTHGGFLGDGDLTATVLLKNDNESEEFIKTVEKKWMKLPINEEEFYEKYCCTFESVKGAIADIDSENGYIFYRDRFFEDNGEYTSFSYNYTLAYFQPDTRTLHLYALDT